MYPLYIYIFRFSKCQQTETPNKAQKVPKTFLELQGNLLSSQISPDVLFMHVIDTIL